MWLAGTIILHVNVYFTDEHVPINNPTKGLLDNEKILKGIEQQHRTMTSPQQCETHGPATITIY